MGMCKPSGGKFRMDGKHGRSIPDVKDAKPNTRTDFYDENGNLTQQRWYDANGRAILDRDWEHGNSKNSHKFPHDHPWDWSKNPPRQESLSNIDNNFC